MNSLRLDDTERRRLYAGLVMGASRPDPSWTVAHALLALDEMTKQTELLREIRDLLAEEEPA